MKGKFFFIASIPIFGYITALFYSRGVEKLEIPKGSQMDITTAPYKDCFRIVIEKPIDIVEF